MQFKKFLPVLVFLITLVFSGFQCSSTELTSAKLYIQQKNYDKAIDALQKDVQKNPSSDEGYYLLGVVLGEKERYTEMIDAYNKSLSISNKFSESINASKKYFWANLFNRGVAFYQKAVKTEDNTSMMEKTSFDVIICMGNPDQIVASNYKGLKTEMYVYAKSNLYLHFSSGKVVGYTRINDNNSLAIDSCLGKKEHYFNQAIYNFSNAIMIEPDSADTYKNLAFVYMSAQDYDNAISPLEKLIELENKSDVVPPNVGENVSTLESKLGRPDKVIETKYKNIEATQYIYEKYNLYVFIEKDKVVGFQRIKDSATGSALDGYKFLSEIFYVKGVEYKNKYDSGKLLSDSLEAMNYFNKAIGVAEEGRKKYPDDSDILLTLSNSYIAANKIEVAIDAFKTGVEKDPTNQYYRYNYGVLLLGKNDFAGAEEQFKKALEIDPDYYNASYNLAVTYVKWGAYINKVADEKGDLNNKEYREKYQKALPYLEKIVQNKKDDPQMWELLGKVYSVLGMQDDASNAFKKADELRK